MINKQVNIFGPLFLLLIIMVFTPLAKAQRGSSSQSSSSSSSGSSGPSFALSFHLDFSAAFGYTGAQRDDADSTKTDLTQTELASTLGALVTESLFVGVLFEYRMINQYSEVKEEMGSLEGKRTFIAPTVGLKFSEWLIKLSIQNSGDLNFSKRAANGASLQYTQPSGFQLGINYAYALPFYLGLVYENLTFSQLVRSDEILPISEKLNFTKVSGVVTWVY